MTDQPGLFGEVPARELRPAAAGPTEAATRRSLNAAARAGDITYQHEGAGAALCDLAWALDAARAAGKFYGVAQAAPPYTELARALGLTTEGKGGGEGDQLDDWLRGLTSPAMGDPAQP